MRPRRAVTEEAAGATVDLYLTVHGVAVRGVVNLVRVGVSQVHSFLPCALLSQFYFEIFHLFHFHTGGQFLLPQRANNEKREFTQLQKWTRQRGLSAWVIQTGPFAGC